MPWRAALVIDAPPRAVRDAITAVPTWVRAAAATGRSLRLAGRRPPAGALAAGDLMGFQGRWSRALFRVAHIAGDTGDPPSGPVEVVRLRGVGRHDGWLITVTAAATRAGSLVTVQVRAGRGARRSRVVGWAELLLGVIVLSAAERADAGSAGPVGPVGSAGPGRADGTAPVRDADAARSVVVAGVVIRDGAILAARRTYPPELAGRWECPGGKVEPGESETDALARELAEELGITVTAGERVGPEYDVGRGYVLHAYRAELVSGEPSPSVHDAIRWVTASEIDEVDWLPADAPLIPVLRQMLGAAGAAGAAGSGTAGIVAGGVS